MIGDNVPKILVARDGFDVRTADVKDLTIDSTKNQLKEYMSGSGTITLTKGFGPTAEILEISHNLGYQPLFTGWFRLNGTTSWRTIPGGFLYDYGGETETTILGAMDRPSDNILQIHFYDFDLFPEYTKAVDYKYIIYIDPYKDAWSS
jgi:hypothetical protein